MAPRGYRSSQRFAAESDAAKNKVDEKLDIEVRRF